MPFPREELWALRPEYWLTALGLVLLVLDLALPAGRKTVVGWAAVVGLVLGLGPIVSMLGEPVRTVFFNTYAVDGFATFFKLVVVGSTVLVTLSAMDYFRGQTAHEGELYALLVFTALGLVLMAGSADLILLALAIEFVSLTSYVLAGYLKADARSTEAGIKYFLFGAGASAVMLYGFSVLYGLTGETNLYAIATKLRAAPQPAVVVALVLSLAGFGFKISMVPFHQWTPDVYEGAPTPIAAYLSVASKAAGFAALVRLLVVALAPTSVDWITLIAGLSALSMTLGNLLALPQRNIKRMLAYSSISHAGFLLIGVAAYQGDFGTPGLLLYVLAYTFTNLGAFFVAIVVGQRLGSDAIPDYAGLAQRAPGLAALMALFMLSLTGIPPTAGFLGKFYLFGAAINNGLLWLAAVGVVNSVIALYYYVNVIRVMYLLPPTSPTALGEPAPLRLALGVAAVGTLLVGVFPQPFIELVRTAGLLARF
ncbi:MAG: NADH-quinone oxidoreductase subunit N [Armatimonadota bacterium]|nr:NADH-quinone oxidoreductase subunit N [Armatimonadota bacterium]MDR7534254.1 NADH-quinone oxidoreductase subunit N [Armatimonadota bacterium]MDR7535808.1 NADH-quinone oxidoreductase subunit N [Armatimonadota bacterium]